MISRDTPLVTIVVVTRERYGYIRESLKHIYECSDIPFSLIYVDCGSPARYRAFLERQAVDRRFDLIRLPYFITPAKARNVGLRCVRTRYAVVLDNDVRVTHGWLGALVACAEDTGAAMVGPLIGEVWSPEDLVHYGGGRAGIRERVVDGRRHRSLYKKVRNNGMKLDTAVSTLNRRRAGLVEFHCALIRTEVLGEAGFLDEQLDCEDHTDFSIRVNHHGGTIYFEPASVVVYVSSPVRGSDIVNYMLRWSDAWQIRSLDYLRDKWNVEEDEFFRIRKARTGELRRRYILAPFARRLLPWRTGRGAFERILIVADRYANRALVATLERYRRLALYSASIARKPGTIR